MNAIASPDGYVSMWDAFAKRKAHSYLTDKYDLRNIVGLTGMAREHEILKHLELKPSDTLIDVGCASGHQVFAAASVVKRAAGVDVAADFVNAGKKYAEEHGIKNAEFKVTDGTTIPYPDASFTKLICSEVIEHIPDSTQLLSEIMRVLVPGGRAVFTVPNWNSRGTVWKRIIYGFKEPPFTPMTEFSSDALAAHGDAHVHQFSPKSFSDRIRKGGFEIEYVGGAAYIDAPKIGRIISITNRLAFFRWLTYGIERMLAATPGWKALGRHIVLAARKPVAHGA